MVKLFPEQVAVFTGICSNSKFRHTETSGNPVDTVGELFWTVETVVNKSCLDIVVGRGDSGDSGGTVV